MEAMPLQDIDAAPQEAESVEDHLKANYFYVIIDTERPGSSLFIIRCDFELEKNIKNIKDTLRVDAPECIEEAQFDCFIIPYAESNYVVAGTHIALLEAWKELATKLEMHLQPGLPQIADSEARFPFNHPSSMVFTLQNDNCSGDVTDLLGREQDLITSYMDGLKDDVFDEEIDAACGIDIVIGEEMRGPYVLRKSAREEEEEGGDEGGEGGDEGGDAVESEWGDGDGDGDRDGEGEEGGGAAGGGGAAKSRDSE